MKLAIADPPYPPAFAERRDVPGGRVRVTSRSRARRWYGDGTRARGDRPADFHDAAGEWDAPARHRQLLEDLLRDFDGFAIATTPDGLEHYRPLPIPARILVWHKPRALPTSHRIAGTWEAVILYPAEGRRARVGTQVPDLLSAPAPNIGFAGAKPTIWTRWVLDALGYDQDSDELVDVFPGSGSVAAAAAQGVLI